MSYRGRLCARPLSREERRNEEEEREEKIIDLEKNIKGKISGEQIEEDSTEIEENEVIFQVIEVDLQDNEEKEVDLQDNEEEEDHNKEKEK